MLLVDADQAEPADRREDRGARADDDPRVAARDPSAFVAPLRFRQSRVEQRDALAEARAEATDRLRRQRDLGTSTIAPSPRSSTAAHACR